MKHRGECDEDKASETNLGKRTKVRQNWETKARKDYFGEETHNTNTSKETHPTKTIITTNYNIRERHKVKSAE